MNDSVNNPSERLLHASWDLMQAARKGGVGAIIEKAGEIFDCPVLFVDDCFRLIASCPAGPTEDEKWNRILAERSLDLHLIWNILEENVQNAESFYKPFYSNTGLCREHPLIMGELLFEKTVYGHILICLGEIPLQEDDLDLVSSLIYILELNLNRREENIDHWHKSMSTRLQDLLTLDTPEHLIDLAVDTLGSSLSSRFAVLVTPFGSRASQQAFAHLAVVRLQEKFRNVVSLIFDNGIVTLFGGVKYSAAAPILRPDNNYLADQLFSYFEQYNMKSGLSNSFQDLRYTRLYYHQALFAAQLSTSMNAKGRAIFMDQMPLPLFSALLKTEPGRVFIHPVIFQIRSYDKKHSTVYEHTLRIYELSMRNKDEAASRLNIHKNTLQYRLNRIMDLFDLPLDDTWTSLNLLCTSLMLQIDESLGDRNTAPHR